MRGKRHGVGLLVLVMMVLVGCGQRSVAARDSLTAFTAHLDARVPALMDWYDVPGVSIALVRDGEQVWAGAYGVADRDTGRPMTVDAVFRVESISKPVTAWGVMRLVEAGRIDLDAPVARYLDTWTFPESPYDEETVTVRQLLSNSGGLALGTVGEEYRPNEERPTLRTHLSRNVRLVRAPGSAFSYSNAGFDLLELLVESVTGRDFAAYMTATVLRPLGMHRAQFGWADSLATAMPTGYDRAGTPVPPYVYPGNAAGGLFADVGAIARFAQSTVTDADRRAVLSDSSVRVLHTPQVTVPGLYGMVTDAYGLGHFTETLPDGHRAVWHGGQGHGWMSHVHAVPATGDAIVILTNSGRSWPLMAEVLTDWGRWSGIGAVKMGRITTATTALWVGIALVVLASLWGAGRLVWGLRSGRRRWGPTARTGRLARLGMAGIGVGVLAVLMWAAAQPYLTLTSVFPVAADWAGLALLIGSLVLVASALFPQRQ
ncbi:MAG TPA: serine hydrolase domain-containing protein [Salinibacter sp.]|nr:serine hydrolase domain-containing protein [Salinibacter sp.]